MSAMTRGPGLFTELLAAPVAAGCGSDAGAKDAGLEGVPSVDASDARQDSPTGDEGVVFTQGSICKVGNYTGAFTGTYTSYLATSIHSLSVVGQVNLTLGLDLQENCGEG